MKKGRNLFVPQRINYFLPDWDDLVDPGFDFIGEISSPGRRNNQDDYYAHEIFPCPPYDGILISRAVTEKKKIKGQLMRKKGVHAFLRLPKKIPVMGDCGAFEYIDLPNPPYSVENVHQYYCSIGVDIGVSVDHLIVKGKEEEKKHRFEITLQNAAHFFRLCQRDTPFIPLGAAQGWDPSSYARAVTELQKMGYRRIGLGGLVRTSSRDIIEILSQVNLIRRPDVRLHLFGIARPEHIHTYWKLGVSSVDSASFLRQAWLSLDKNYFTGNGKFYTALRVPQALRKPVQEKANKLNISQDKLLEREQTLLKNLRSFDQEPKNFEALADEIIEYNRMTGNTRVKQKAVVRTLRSQPWKKCSCPICQQLGIEVIIFRGNNRNRRRGFHNTRVFYQQLKEKFKKKAAKPAEPTINQACLPGL